MIIIINNYILIYYRKYYLCIILLFIEKLINIIWSLAYVLQNIFYKLFRKVTALNFRE